MTDISRHLTYKIYIFIKVRIFSDSVIIFLIYLSRTFFDKSFQNLIFCQLACKKESAVLIKSGSLKFSIHIIIFLKLSVYLIRSLRKRKIIPVIQFIYYLLIIRKHCIYFSDSLINCLVPLKIIIAFYRLRQHRHSTNSLCKAILKLLYVIGFHSSI